MGHLSRIFSDEEMSRIILDFDRLRGKCYLDNTGASMFPSSLLESINKDLLNNVYLNPHSDKFTADCIDQVRYAVLKHFKTNADEYSVIFTSGSTASLKLVAESFHFHSADKKGAFVYLADNHTSVLGMREIARQNEVLITTIPHDEFVNLKPAGNLKRVNSHDEFENLKQADNLGVKGNAHNDFANLERADNLGVKENAHNKFAILKQADNLGVKDNARNELVNLKRADNLRGIDENALFVYPAQSNFNGFKYSLDHISAVRRGCLNERMLANDGKTYKNWYVMLDAACYVSTNRLDLSEHKPDFLCISFYKIFGFPTGLGALLVRNVSAAVLSQKCYFGGGTVDVVLSCEDFHVKRNNLCQRFEDGTISFLSILSLNHCFSTLERLIPKLIDGDIMNTISHHTFYLAKDLYGQLKSLRHSNGTAAAVVYADSDYCEPREQGGAVAFNLMRPDGAYIGYAEFQHMADLFSISARTGCFCNSGSCQRHLKLTAADVMAGYKAGHICGDEIDLFQGKPTGCVRVSFGYYNTFKDIDVLMAMMCKCFVQAKAATPDRSVINGFYKEIQVIDVDMINHMDNVKSIDHNDRSGKEWCSERGMDKKNHMTNIKSNNSIDRSEKEWNEIDMDKNYMDKIKSNYHIDRLDKKSCKDGTNDESINYNGNKDKTNGRLEEIAIFPIKSCGAYKPEDCWKIGAKGFEFDRAWMIIRDNGACLTQKQCARMCMIRPSLDFEEKLLILNFPEMPSITVPIDKTSKSGVHASLCQSKVCNDFVQGYDCGEQVGDWISEALGISFLRLIKQCETDERLQRPKTSETQNPLSLSNQAQYLLINASTVRWLAEEIDDEEFDTASLVDRFRGNIVVDAGKELVECDWTRVVIGKHEFKVESPCTRCQMICIDQESGDKTTEPLRTISKVFAGKMRFGIYLSYLGTTDNSGDRLIYINTHLAATNKTDIS